MNFFKCLANDWTDITDLSSSGSELHKQFPLNLIDLCGLRSTSQKQCEIELR